MIFQRRKVASALACMLGVGCAVTLISAPARAADIKIDVTGTNIKRVEGEGALPVTVMTREDIDRAGAQTAYEILNYISANNSGGNISIGNVIGTTTFSAQTASLRGLTGQDTLILVNGKRLQNFAGEVQGIYGVNLDVIPFSAIERVEVLRDGASAIYGSDAIGGVINFILRQDYKGYEATAYYGAPTRSGGGSVWSAKGTAGWGDLNTDKYNVFISASYQEAKPLLQSERNFSNTSFIPTEGVDTTSGNTFPGFISTGGIGSLDFPACPSPNVNSGTRCRFDPAKYAGVESFPDQKLTNVFGSARYQFNTDWQAYFTGFYSEATTRFIIQPTPISDQFPFGVGASIPGNIFLPPTSPFYPHAQAIAAGVDGQPLNVRYRCVECGNRDTTDTNKGAQGVAGIKGNWINWDLDFDFFYSEGKTTEHLNNGFPLLNIITPLLSSGTVNLFGPNTPDISAAVQATNFKEDTFKGTGKNYGVEGKGSRDIYNLPAGPLALAAGFLARRETLDQSVNPQLQTGLVSGYGGNFLPISVSRTNTALYAELNIPVVKNLETDVAVRYDHYSDFGSTTNPKASVRWNPVKELLFRTSYGTGFVAPSLTQLHANNTTTVSSPGLSDPVRCPVTGDSNDCSTQFGVLNGGSLTLKPEKASQWQFGVVWEPVTGFSLGVDQFNLHVKDLFSTGPTAGTILASVASITQFANLVTRGPSAPPFPNLPGRIIQIDQRFLNIGKVNIQGFDVDARARFPATDYGQFTLTLNGTYYEKYDTQNTDGTFSGNVSNQNNATVTGITPRWKHYATATWTYGPWSATLGQTYQSDYIDVNTTCASGASACFDPNNNLRRVSSLNILDLYTAYTGLKNWKFVLGVKNIMDRNPPFTNQNNTFQVGYDPSYYDARARFVYGSITFAYK